MAVEPVGPGERICYPGSGRRLSEMPPSAGTFGLFWDPIFGDGRIGEGIWGERELFRAYYEKIHIPIRV